MSRVNELAKEIRESFIWDFWDLDQLEELCELADIEEEWKNSDGETFEQVVYKAAEKLGVEIL